MAIQQLGVLLTIVLCQERRVITALVSGAQKAAVR
jgi:hypothetical protein